MVMAGVFIAVLTIQGVPKACATIAPSTCDTRIWQQMSDRASLQMQREITQNQSLIYKADSILQYVCFTRMAGHAAERIGTAFTHTTYFGDTIIDYGSPYGMDFILNRVVADSMQNYIQANYNHAYLGGRGRDLQPALDAPDVSTVSRGVYSCGEMGRVWATAKCINFMHNDAFADRDGFFPFRTIPAFNGAPSITGYNGMADPRHWPTQCTSLPDNWWATTANNSENRNDSRYPYTQPNAQVFQQVRVRIQPATTAGQCTGVVRTGRRILTSLAANAQTIQEIACINPGCSPNAAGTQCVSGGMSTPNAQP